MFFRTAAICAVAWAVAIIILKSNHAESACRMAYMNPKYIPHPFVDSKYGLYLYRDMHWNVGDSITPDGIPVLFIPGNAGSYKQGRSIAAEISKQYHIDYNRPNHDLASQNIPLPDLWTVDFKEELSAFHAGLVRRQAEYCRSAVDYILSQYAGQSHPPESVIVIAHSMGGVVAREMFHLTDYRQGSIDLLLTLSSPNAIPPTPFSRSMSSLFGNNLSKHTEIAISGGSADSLLPADVTYAPISQNSLSVLSTTIPGVWAPISHQAIVWCDQLRRKIARGVLLSVDSSKSSKLKSRESLMEIWKGLLVGISNIPDTVGLFDVDLNATVAYGAYTTADIGSDRTAWSLGRPPPHSVTGDKAPIVRLVTSLTPEPPYKDFGQYESPIQVLACQEIKPLKRCRHLPIRDSVTLPYLHRDTQWLPVRHGADEDHTMYLLDADTDTLDDNESVVLFRNGKDGKRHWITSQFAPADEEIVIGGSLTRMLFSSVPLLEQNHGIMALRRRYKLINAPSTSLVAYRIDAKQSTCVSTQFNNKELFQPLLRHVVGSLKGIEETYHPDLNGRIAIESHLSQSPYLIADAKSNKTELIFEVFADTSSTESCYPLQELSVSVDILASISKWGTRYRSALVGFALGIWCVAFRRQLQSLDLTGASITLLESLTVAFPREILAFCFIMVGSVLASSLYAKFSLYFVGLHDPKLCFVGPILLLASYGLISGVTVAITGFSAILSFTRLHIPKFKISRKRELGLMLTTAATTLLIPQQVMLSLIGIYTLLTDNSTPLALSIRVLVVLLAPFYIPVTVVWLKDPLMSSFGVDFEDHNPLPILPIVWIVLHVQSCNAIRKHRTTDRLVWWIENSVFVTFALSSLAFSGRYAYILYEGMCILLAILSYTRYFNCKTE
ncbi:hypothetical protein E3P86_00910 [Wallemia ichthyophaga]|uniref:GPI inositol-deacylase n=1 Tax=Wallemia ichthyophaga TaxID=245174 RepID=A0A4T0JB18_WALIC|nr:hypothetical protein E3P86_00910 [Wallemia ichthyophaga]